MMLEDEMELEQIPLLEDLRVERSCGVAGLW